MVYSGTLTEGKMIYTGTTTAPSGNTRLVIASISEGNYKGLFATYKTALICQQLIWVPISI